MKTNRPNFLELFYSNNDVFFPIMSKLDARSCLSLGATCHIVATIFKKLHTPLDIQITKIDADLRTHSEDYHNYDYLVLTLDVKFCALQEGSLYKNEKSPDIEIDVNKILVFLENPDTGASFRLTNYTSPFVTEFQLKSLNLPEDDRVFEFRDHPYDTNKKTIRITFDDYMHDQIISFHPKVIIDRGYRTSSRRNNHSFLRASIGYFDLFGLSISEPSSSFDVPYIAPYCMFGECTIKLMQGILFIIDNFSLTTQDLIRR